MGEFAALIGSYDTVSKAELCEERPHNSNRGGFACCKKYPNSSGSTIDNDEVRTAPVVGENNPISCLVRAFVVVARRAHKPKVQEEFTTASWESFGFFPRRLLPYVGLLFKVNVAEGVVFKDWWGAIDVFREYVELAFPR